MATALSIAQDNALMQSSEALLFL